jgi:hypothetical protein
MKCPECWADRAYRRKTKGLKEVVLSYLFLVPMRCHHCYHKFFVFLPLNWGKQFDAPAPRAPSKAPTRPSHAFLAVEAQRAQAEARRTQQEPDRKIAAL